MQTDSTLPAFSGDLRGAVLSNYANITEDGTICFVCDKIHRVCPSCGTVFASSVSRAAFAGPPACPYCGAAPCLPLLREHTA